MEAIFKQAKEEQEKADQAFEEEHRGGEAPDATVSVSPEPTASVSPTKRGRRGKKASETLGGSSLTGADNKLLVAGSTVQVVSGTFSGFSGILKKLDKKAGLVFFFLLSFFLPVPMESIVRVEFGFAFLGSHILILSLSTLCSLTN